MKTITLRNNNIAYGERETKKEVRQRFSYPGPQGPQGPQGPAGTPGGSAYEHVQSAASSTWNINHNLGVRPLITLLSSGGVEFDGEVVHVSNSQAIAYLVEPMTGSARCI